MAADDEESKPTRELAPNAEGALEAEVVPAPPSVTSQEVDAGGEDVERNTMMSLVDLALPPLAETHGARRYDEGALLGSGGMGEVRLSHDRRLGRRVARKVLHLAIESAQTRERFLREVRVQGQLEHPGIVPVYDLDEEADGSLWFAMKRVRGETLESVMTRLSAGDRETRQRYSTRRLLAAFAQVCHTVHYAHSRGVVHRDLKPANVMLGDFGEVYVLDWGLALVLTDGAIPRTSGGDRPSPAVMRLTGGDTVVGTLAYMAPEQVTRRKEGVDGRADVYALGVLLFEILTLQRLRPKASLLDVIEASRSGTRPSARVKDVPPELDDLCARALSPSRADRPPSARVLAEHVERFLDGDRDVAMRRELAAHHVARAGDLLAHTSQAATPADRAELRVAALREAAAALGLVPDDREAQGLLVATLTGQDAREAPPEAEEALARDGDARRAEGARLGMIGLLVWLLALPLAVLVGVRDWAAVGATAIVTTAAAALSGWMWKRRRFGLGTLVVLATLVATVVALTGCYLGPFAIVPTCATAATLFFAMHATRNERRAATGLLALGALAPFVLEWLGVLGRAYTFNADGLQVHVRGIALPETPTMLAMLYSTLTFVLVAGWMVGRMRDSLAASERRLFLQAWTMRQVFRPAEEAATGATTGTS